MIGAETITAIVGGISSAYEGDWLRHVSTGNNEKLAIVLDRSFNVALLTVATINVFKDLGLLADFAGGYLAVKAINFADNYIFDSLEEPMREAIEVSIDEGGELPLYPLNLKYAQSSTDPVSASLL